jgi:nicotinate phosphoribosyltransferase
MRGDVLSLENDTQAGEPLIMPVMRSGQRIAPAPTLAQIRERAARDLARLPEPLRRLEPGACYPVKVADALSALAAAIDTEACATR